MGENEKALVRVCVSVRSLLQLELETVHTMGSCKSETCSLTHVCVFRDKFGLVFARQL